MSSSRVTRIAIAAAVAAVLVAGLLVAVGVLVAPSTASASEQVFLEGTTDVGASPFVPAAGRKSPALPSQPGVGIDTVECDPNALVAALEGDAGLAAAWTGALNTDATLVWSGGNAVRPDQVGAYIAELVPRVLDQDVRVTNFQYRGGAPTSVQSVLQAGSSVLVDKAGVVRVRCKCGNPLTPMKRITGTPTYQGTPWDGVWKIKIVITCEDEEFYDDGECRDDCEDGYYYDDGDCRPIECDDGEEFRDGACRPDRDCDDGEEFRDGACRPKPCPDGTERVDGNCPKPPDADCDDNDKVNGQCPEPPPPPPGGCATALAPDGSCPTPVTACTGGQVKDADGRCQCPPGQTLVGNVCQMPPTCAEGQVEQQGECVAAVPENARTDGGQPEGTTTPERAPGTDGTTDQGGGTDGTGDGGSGGNADGGNRDGGGNGGNRDGGNGGNRDGGGSGGNGGDQDG